MLHDTKRGDYTYSLYQPGGKAANFFLTEYRPEPGRGHFPVAELHGVKTREKAEAMIQAAPLMAAALLRWERAFMRLEPEASLTMADVQGVLSDTYAALLKAKVQA